MKSENEAASGGVINIFTDGSKKKEGAGCGIYSRNLQIRYKRTMDERARIIQPELVGITIATKEIVRRQITDKIIRTYTHCRQSLLAPKNYKITTGVVWECHQAHVCWVKRYTQCSGNKEDPRLAKKATSQDICGPSPPSLLSITAIIQLIKENTHSEFKKLWDETNSCQLARELLKYPNKSTAMDYLAMSKKNHENVAVKVS